MKIGLLTLSNEGAQLIARLAELWPGSEMFVYETVNGLPQARRFSRIIDLTQEVFHQFQGLVYVAPAGVVVRALAASMEHGMAEPAVVVVDVGGRWVISLLGGREGGPNHLAFAVANVLGAEPIVTTTTEAAKRLIVGVDCGRGTPGDAIVAAVRAGLSAAGQDAAHVRVLAAADIADDETGLQEAARLLGVPLRLVPSAEIAATPHALVPSETAEQQTFRPALAEPAALLAGRRTQLLLPQSAHPGVTVAIAQELPPRFSGVRERMRM